MKSLSNRRRAFVERCLSTPTDDPWWIQSILACQDGKWVERYLSVDEIRKRTLALLKPKPDDLCMDCGVDAFDIGHDYMLHDELWLSIHPQDDGKLCLHCVEKRLGRPTDQGRLQRCGDQ